MTVSSKWFHHHHHRNHDGQNKEDLVGPVIVNTAVIQMSRLHLLHLGGVLVTILFAASSIASESAVTEPSKEQFLNGDPVIAKFKPERKGGRGFKLTYSVDASLDMFWKFKTDFDSTLLLGNKFINSHRLVSHLDNVVITETEYSHKSRAVFRWQTTVFPEQHLLRYELLNPEECGQKYHYGYIQLEALDYGTRVNQVTYFDFFGASLWVNYPFKGGMTEVLNYTARWEQEYISEFGYQYKN